MIKAHGEDHEQYLIRETLTQPHRTYIDSTDREEDQVKIQSQTLKDIMKKELLNQN